MSLQYISPNKHLDLKFKKNDLNDESIKKLFDDINKINVKTLKLQSNYISHEKKQNQSIDFVDKKTLPIYYNNVRSIVNKE